MRWSVRCDRFFRLRHRSIARLVDYGLVGQAMRFEAWRCGERWRGSRRAASGALAQVTIFLHAIGTADGAISLDDIRTDAGRPVLLPRSATGYDGGAGGPADDLSSCGITIVERPSVKAVAEILASANGPALPAVMLGAVAGAGGSVAIHQLARVARLQGFVPMALQLDAVRPIELLDDRSLCMIDRLGGSSAWRSLLDRLLISPRPHMLLSVGAHTLPKVRCLHLERVPEESLMLAITPPVESTTLRRTIKRAAKRADGLPARFAELLWGAGSPAGPARVKGTAIAAERPPSYGDACASRALAAPVAARNWPAPADVAVQRKRLTEALELIGSGRHAPGERGLRAVIGGLARRHDWHQAARGQLALGAALLRRGRARQARETLAEVRTYAVHGGQDAGRGAKASSWKRRFSPATPGWTKAGWTRPRPCCADRSPRLDPRATWRSRPAPGRRWLDASSGAGTTAKPMPRSTKSARRPMPTRQSAWRLSGRAWRSAAEISARGCLTRRAPGTVPSDMANPWPSHAQCTPWRLHIWRLAICGASSATCCPASRPRERRTILCARSRLGFSRLKRPAAPGLGGAAERLVSLVARASRIDLPATVRARLALLSDLSAGIDRAVRKHVTGTGLHALGLFAPARHTSVSPARTTRQSTS